MSSAPLFLFKDNVSTLAASAIASSDTTIAVSTGTGADFPPPGANQQLAVTIEDVSGNIEVVYCTGISGDTLTVVRAQEGYSAQNFASGSRVEMRVTSGILASFLQKHGNDTMNGTTDLTGVLALGSGGSIQGGEFTGALRGSPGETDNQITVPTGGGAPKVGTSPILTKSNIESNLPVGYGLVASQMVLMWSGASNAIPAGYLICDGNNQTPNLENHFIVGAGASYGLGTVGNVSGTTNATTGGAPAVNPVVLVAGNLPVHKHPFDYWDGSGVAIIGDPPFANPGSYFFMGSGAGTKVSYAGSPNAAPNAVAFTPTTVAPAAHTHTFTATAPPFYGLFFIMKT